MISYPIPRHWSSPHIHTNNSKCLNWLYSLGIHVCPYIKRCINLRGNRGHRSRRRVLGGNDVNTVLIYKILNKINVKNKDFHHTNTILLA